MLFRFIIILLLLLLFFIVTKSISNSFSVNTPVHQKLVKKVVIQNQGY